MLSQPSPPEPRVTRSRAPAPAAEAADPERPMPSPEGAENRRNPYRQAHDYRRWYPAPGGLAEHPRQAMTWDGTQAREQSAISDCIVVIDQAERDRRRDVLEIHPELRPPNPNDGRLEASGGRTDWAFPATIAQAIRHVPSSPALAFLAQAAPEAFEPITRKQALDNDYRRQWLDAQQEELESLRENGTWKVLL